MASPLRSIDSTTRRVPVAPRRATGGPIGRAAAPVALTARRRPSDAQGAPWRTVGVGAHIDHGFSVSCDDCSLAGSPACADCIVTFLCPEPAASNGRTAGGSSAGCERSVSVTAAEAETLALFRDVGLAPQLRHVPRSAAAQ